VLSNRIRTALISVITAVWAANFTAPIFEHNYQPPAEINLAFMGVVGILTATYDRTKDNKDSGNGSGSSKRGGK